MGVPRFPGDPRSVSQFDSPADPVAGAFFLPPDASGTVRYSNRDSFCGL